VCDDTPTRGKVCPNGNVKLQSNNQLVVFVLFSLGGVKLMGIETHLHLDESQNGGDTSRNQFGVRKQKEKKI
jgi:hypothetical protein